MKPARVEGDVVKARQLRQSMTFPERLLFGSLRKLRDSGIVFRRQHPLGPFVADFYCASARLVVEVDGPTHNRTGEFDAARNAWMQDRGITVLRFTVYEIDQQLEGVVKTIQREALRRTALNK